MFMRKTPSPQAQENLDWLMDGIFETQVNLISSGRKVDVAKVRAVDRSGRVQRGTRQGSGDHR